MSEKIDCLVIGSGAGGAVTALRLAEKGRRVVLLEEGRKHEISDYGRSPPEAMRLLYRRRGMTPIVGKSPIGYVEGCCVGGSTEISSGFWHRTPREILLRWKAQFDLGDASPEELGPHFEWAEQQLGVSTSGGKLPTSSEVFARGINRMGWVGGEVPRAARGCKNSNACASGCPTGAKPGISRSVLPRALNLGVTLLSGCRVQFLLRRGRRVVGVLAEIEREPGRVEQIRIQAEHIFVCGGATQTPALLRRSGIRTHVGNSLSIHPMLKVVAEYDSEIRAGDSVLPLIQVKEFWPDISMGGAFFTPGHAAVMLSENWRQNQHLLEESQRLSAYYVAVRGVGRGLVRPSSVDADNVTIRYDLADEDIRHLSNGLARLSTALLAGGAIRVYPAVFGLPAISDEVTAMRWLDERLPRSAISATTVHAFSSCPMGQKRDRCAVDSFGKVFAQENLYVNDASMLPCSPGVNPTGSIMALASRNAQHFAEQVK